MVVPMTDGHFKGQVHQVTVDVEYRFEFTRQVGKCCIVEYINEMCQAAVIVIIFIGLQLIHAPTIVHVFVVIASAPSVG